MATHAMQRPHRPHGLVWTLVPLLMFGTFLSAAPRWALAQQGAAPAAPEPAPPSTPQNAVPPQSAKSVIYRMRETSERLEMVVNSSRIVTLGQKIPQVQVNNPDILDMLILSPSEVQLSAKKPGVTQVNLWGEDKRIYTLDVISTGDVRELTMILQREFPGCAVRISPLANGVLLSGYVDHPQSMTRIREIAEEYYPKVLNNMTVGGVQQVVLHVKVMEVSRTKLRRLGFDFAKITNGSVVYSAISGLISSASGSGVAASAGTFGFAIGRSNTFFGVLDALRQDNLLKVLAEPNLVTISGRAAFFQCGGEFPILVPQSLGTVSIDYKKFGTQIDFVPIVLGNGRIHLDVRPRVSEIDPSRSVTVGSTTVPGLRTREAETGVEMDAGQTLAIAGLVQQREESENRGLPWVSEMPYVGALFRRVEHEINEIELLVLVTPELVEAMDPSQTPPCGPGGNTTAPGDVDLYLRGHLEVPKCCPPGTAEPAAPNSDAAQRGGGIRLNNVAVGGGLRQPDSVGGGEPQPQNQQLPKKPQPTPLEGATSSINKEPRFIGPVGYDVK